MVSMISSDQPRCGVAYDHLDHFCAERSLSLSSYLKHGHLKHGHSAQCAPWWLATILLLITTSLGCKTTEFRQDRADSTQLTLSCETRPAGAVLPNSPLTLMVQGARGYKGRIEQKVTGPDFTDTTTLTRKDEIFSREDLAENTFHFFTEGDYTVNLKALDYGIELTGQCRFTVFDKCPVNSQRVGVNVVFVVDNSSSHEESDPGKPETHRERAVLYAQSILSEIGQHSAGSQSFLSFVTFPLSSLNGGQPPGLGTWYSADGDSTQLINALHVLRAPSGVTPYHEGIEKAKELFMEVQDREKKNILILITDGYPTDQDPKETLELTQSLSSLDVEVVAVMVTGSPKQHLSDQHRLLMEEYFYKNGDIWHASHYADADAYFMDLLGNGSLAAPGLLYKMTSGSVISIADSLGLKDKVSNLVIKEVLTCQEGS